jgi:zinc-ribbon domain
MQAKPARPTGVTVLGVLAILVGLGGIVVGGLLVLAAAVISTLNIASSYPQLAGFSSGTIAVVLGVLGGVLLIIGILYLVTGIGFFGGKGWAWTIGLIVSVLSIIVNIIQAIISPGGLGGAIFSIIIPLIIIYYLTRPHVKAFFSKGPAMGMPGTAPSAGMTSPTMATSTMGGGTMRCTNCGASVPAGSTKCPSCGAPM